MKKILILSFLFFVFIGIRRVVFADINPPSPAGQGNVTPIITTKVQMKNEKVEFVIANPQIATEASYPSGNLPIKVTAQFNMYNTSDSTEKIDITFPKCDYYSTNYFDCWAQRFSNFTVSVNNNKINTVSESSENIPVSQLAYKPRQTTVEGSFYKWNQSFPAKQITTVTITYDLNVNLYDPYHNYYLDYVLSTGGNWYGNIEHGEILFSSPKKPLDEYFSLSSGNKEGFSKKLTKSIDGNTLRVTFDNIKPSFDENIHLSIFDPQERDIIDSLKEKAQNTNTAVAYSKLAGAYANLSVIHIPYENGNYSSRAFTYFDKAITLATKFSDLQQITNNLFFTKNGGDLSEATQLKDSSCETENIFCERGNWVYETVAWHESERNIMQELANKRLTFSKDDKFALNILDILKQNPLKQIDSSQASASSELVSTQSGITSSASAQAIVTPVKNTKNKIPEFILNNMLIVSVIAIIICLIFIYTAIITIKRFISKKKRTNKQQDETSSSTNNILPENNQNNSSN